MDHERIMLPLPDELDHSFFFSSYSIELEKPIKGLPENFIYEILFYHGFPGDWPWKNETEAIPNVINKWKIIKKRLEELYSIRDQTNTLKEMKKGIGLFLQFLFWSNEKPVRLKEPFDLNQLDWKPVNIEERFAFIIARPNLYHSFRQLSELMVEQEKVFVKKNIVKKASRG